MGCFNFGCSISGLPIGEGDKVRAMLVTRSIYPDDNMNREWGLRTLPIRAKYNDYGSIEKLNPQDKYIQQNWLDVLKEDLVEKDVGENKYHDPPIKKNSTFEQLLEALWERRVEVASYGPPTSVALIMVREDVWQSLCGMSLKGWHYKEKETRGLEYYVQQADLLLRKAHSVQHSGNHDENFAFREGLTGRDSPIWWLLFHTEECAPIVGVGRHIQKMLTAKKLSEELLTKISTVVGETYLVTTLLRGMGIALRPALRGSQCGEWDLHSRFHRDMASIALAELKSREED